MVVVKKLAAELQIQLIAELAAALLDVLGLQGQILVVVKSDLHVQYPFFTRLNFQNNSAIIHPRGAGEKGVFHFPGAKFRG